jgi:hypothetical protein
MFQFLKRHIIKAVSSLRRGGRHCHFGVIFQVGGESERAFLLFHHATERTWRNHRKDIPANPAAFSPDLYCELVHSTRVNLLAAAARRPR